MMSCCHPLNMTTLDLGSDRYVCILTRKELPQYTQLIGKQGFQRIGLQGAEKLLMKASTRLKQTNVKCQKCRFWQCSDTKWTYYQSATFVWKQLRNSSEVPDFKCFAVCLLIFINPSINTFFTKIRSNLLCNGSNKCQFTIKDIMKELQKNRFEISEYL